MMHARFLPLTLASAMLFMLASCSALDMPAAPDIFPTRTQPPLPSPTIVWFPPSATPSPQAFFTRSPTPEMRPGLGDSILADDFSRPSLWDVATSDQASSAVANRQLTLAAQPGFYITSFRKEVVLSDFYAEITASPSLCRGPDSYGMLVRANAVAYYRFGLSCDGTVHAERISVGTRQILSEPVASGDAPPGAPGQVRIGVWAVGSDMRLFLNGRYQFSVRESNYPTGTVGVFVSAAGSTAVTVKFSDLAIQEVNYNPPTETPLP